jgi:hypothetical protein
VLLQDSHGIVGPLASGAINPDRPVFGKLAEPLAELMEWNVDGGANRATPELFLLTNVQQKSATVP